MKNATNDLDNLEETLDKIIKSKNFTYGLGRALRHIKKEIFLYKNHVAGIKKWGMNKNGLSTEKIQVGGGDHPLNGFLNIDIVPPANLICDLREGIPLPDKCCSLIFNEHFLEHLDYPTSAEKIISEFSRILKYNGRLIIGVPDAELLIEKYFRRDNKFYKTAVNHWFGKRNLLPYIKTYIDLLNYGLRDQDDDKVYTPHLWAYDYEKLNSLLISAGFRKVNKWNFDKKLANPRRKFGTLYVIATR